ncbi:efflux RND transporter periplasmic adaptor subunit [Archangium violaceum]|uniref:efflux RND transporter periplasmic adaptor subunit n=1 Tax=Archangium violaceum TaxID=83451 RepID=UPI0019522A98|nr:efflux RND transporter periplasmic adaptor subunit [Archangium violaceum]QRN97726.1 efflux RND transporter periplasmic adaptor subunit [Archangium violaceum]
MTGGRGRRRIPPSTWLIAGLLGLSGLGVVLANRGAQAPSPSSTAPVPEASRGPGSDAAEPGEQFLGVVLHGEVVELTAGVEGRLASVCCQVGERINRGSVVAALDARETQQELLAAEAALQVTIAQRESIALEVEEARERLARRQATKEAALSAEELSIAEYQKRGAEARLVAAEARQQEQQARVTQLRSQLEEGRLRAPFDAMVAARYVSPGTRLAKGTPVLRLLSADVLRVRFAVPEQVAARLAPGAPVQVSVEATGRLLQATVESVAPEVDAASQQVFALATLTPDAGAARVFGGTTVRVALGGPRTTRVGETP